MSKHNKTCYITIVLRTLVVCVAFSNAYDIQGTLMEKSKSVKKILQTKTNEPPEKSAWTDLLTKEMKISDFSAKDLNRLTSMYNKGRNPTRNKSETNNNRKPSNFHLGPNNYLRSHTKTGKQTEFLSGNTYNDSKPRHGNLLDRRTPRSRICPEYMQRNSSILRYGNVSDVGPILRKAIWLPEKECFEYSDANLKSVKHVNVTKTDNSSISKSLEKENNTPKDMHTLFLKYLVQREQLKNKLTR